MPVPARIMAELNAEMPGVIRATGIDWPRLKARLDDVPENVAPAPDALPDLPDPFPVWRRPDAA